MDDISALYLPGLCFYCKVCVMIFMSEKSQFCRYVRSSFLQLNIILRHFFVSFYQGAFKISKASVLDHFLNNKKYLKKKKQIYTDCWLYSFKPLNTLW